MKKNASLTIFIKVILIGVLIGCTFRLPYGYYQIAKCIVAAGSIWLLYDEYQKRRWSVPIYAISLIVFQPVIKWAFRRDQWQMIDVIAAGVFTIILAVDIILLLKRKDHSFR